MSVLRFSFVWSTVSRRSWFQFLLTLLFTSLRKQRKPKQTICTPIGWLNVSTAFGHILMPSARRWADKWSCTFHNFHTSISVSDFEVAWIPRNKTVGICGITYNAHSFVNMAIYDLKTTLVKFFSVLLNCLIIIFTYLVNFSRLHNFIKIAISPYEAASPTFDELLWTSNDYSHWKRHNCVRSFRFDKS